MSSVNAFKLDQSKILSSGNGLNYKKWLKVSFHRQTEHSETLLQLTPMVRICLVVRMLCPVLNYTDT